MFTFVSPSPFLPAYVRLFKYVSVCVSMYVMYVFLCVFVCVRVLLQQHV